MTTLAMRGELALEAANAVAQTPSFRARIVASVGTACVAALLVLWLRTSGRSNFADVDQVWLAARALLERRNPSDALGGTVWGVLLYPMPAVLVAVPLAALSAVAAHVLFTALGIAGATFTLSRRSWWPCLCLASWPAFDAIQLGQWSPWFVAAAGIPALGWLAVAKPTTGAAVVAAFSRVDRRMLINVGIALALIGVSFLVAPDWFGRWRSAVSSTHHIVPLVMRPGGVLVLAAALRWRRPEARMIVLLAVVPQTLAAYEAVLLALVVRTRWESIAFVILSAAMLPFLVHDGMAFEEMIARNATVILVALYLPCVAMVLRRPNAQEFP